MSFAHEELDRPDNLTAAVADLIEGSAGPEETLDERENENESSTSLEEEEELLAEAGEDAGSEEESEDESQGEQAVADEEAVETLTQFADALGVDPSELYNLSIPVPNGEPVPIGEMKDLYQKYAQGEIVPSGDMQQFNATRQQVEQQVVQKQQQTLEYLKQVAHLPEQLQTAQAHMSQLQDTYNRTNWAELEKMDPGDAALQRQKLQEGYNVAQVQYSQAQQAINGQLQMAQQAQTQHTQRQLLAAHPEWQEPQKMKEADAMMSEFLYRFGFQEGELQGIADPRVIEVVHAAAQMASQQAQSRQAVRKVPTKTIGTLKRGALKATRGRGNTKLNDLLKRAKSSNRIEDKSAAVSALLNDI